MRLKSFAQQYNFVWPKCIGYIENAYFEIFENSDADVIYIFDKNNLIGI